MVGDCVLPFEPTITSFSNLPNVEKQHNAGSVLAFGADAAARLVGDGVVLAGMNAIGLLAFGVDAAAVGDGAAVHAGPVVGTNAIGHIAFGADAAARLVGGGASVMGPNAIGPASCGADAAAVGDGHVVVAPNASGFNSFVVFITFGADAAAVGDGAV